MVPAALWTTGGEADGWMLSCAQSPGTFNDFVDLVVPELQRRGLFRTEYAGRTLREHYGLPRPTRRIRSNDKENAA